MPYDEKKYPASIAQELNDIKKIMKNCCCNLLKKDFSCECNCTCNGNGGGNQCLCIANSKCATGSSGVATVTVPGNSCITKIYTSFTDDPSAVKFAIVEFSSDESSFCQIVPQDSNKAGAFDTSFIQPLCIGPNDITVKSTAYASSGNINKTALIKLTVVYCPNCCGEE